jgi:hypothetical protein
VAKATPSEGWTTIYCPRALRELWSPPIAGKPSPLAEQWRQQYPGLFDKDDLRLNTSQGRFNLHFYEWYAAIHLFQRDGAVSMVEKFAFPDAHPQGRTVHKVPLWAH